MCTGGDVIAFISSLLALCWQSAAATWLYILHDMLFFMVNAGGVSRGLVQMNVLTKNKTLTLKIKISWAVFKLQVWNVFSQAKQVLFLKGKSQ